MKESQEQTQAGARNEQDSPTGRIAALVGRMLRIGVNIVSIPLELLPKQSHHRVRRAMGDVVRTALIPTREQHVTVSGGADAHNGRASTARSEEQEIAERSRRFAERLARSAEVIPTRTGYTTQQYPKHPKTPTENV